MKICLTQLQVTRDTRIHHLLFSCCRWTLLPATATLHIKMARAVIEKIFDSLDVDKDGSISQCELEGIFKIFDEDGKFIDNFWYIFCYKYGTFSNRHFSLKRIKTLCSWSHTTQKWFNWYSIDHIVHNLCSNLCISFEYHTYMSAYMPTKWFPHDVHQNVGT